MKKRRLHKRYLKIWSADYLHYRYLWQNIEMVVRSARLSVATSIPTVIDVGCGHKPYLDLFLDSRYIGLDYRADETSPELLAEATQLPIISESVDIVFSSQVIEHVPEPGLMISEC